IKTSACPVAFGGGMERLLSPGHLPSAKEVALEAYCSRRYPFIGAEVWSVDLDQRPSRTSPQAACEKVPVPPAAARNFARVTRRTLGYPSRDHMPAACGGRVTDD